MSTVLPPLPAVAAEVDITIPLAGRDAVAARVYGQRVPTGGPLVLHFHGGNFLSGDLDNGRVVSQLLAAAGALVVSLEYPLAPQHPFPDGVELGYAVLEWLYDKQRAKLAGKAARVYLAGEEAGANLAAAVALMARDRGHPPLAGQILLSPMLDPCAGTASLRQASESAAECPWAAGWRGYLRSPADAMHPYAVPGAALRLAGLAPTLVLVSEGDAMRDEGVRYAQRLSDAGIAVTQGVLPTAQCWPGALYEPSGSDCACGNTVQKYFREFFGTALSPH